MRPVFYLITLFFLLPLASLAGDDTTNIPLNRQVFHEKLHAWLLDWDHGRSPEFVQLSAEVYAKRIQFYLAVEKVLTPEQRQTAWQRLQNFADDFKSLSKKSVNAGAAPTLADKLALLCLPALDACLPE